MRDLQDLNWDDLRLFTVLAESKSLRQAADRLALTHPTVRRRLNTLESDLGLQLFHRRQRGLLLTAEGRKLATSVREVELAVLTVLRRAEAVDQEMQGPVRVTVASELAQSLAPAFADFQRQWPDIQLLLETGASFADLARFEADVAIRGYRLGRRPKGHLTGRRAVTGCAAVYGDPKATPYWIGATSAPPSSGWTATEAFAGLAVRSVVPEVLVRHAACASGMGIAMMPCLVGDPDLPRLTEPVDDFDIWVLVHPDLRDNARLKVFRDAMVAALAAMKPQLRGAAYRRRQP